MTGSKKTSPKAEASVASHWSVGGLFWGLFIVLIGVLLLINNTGIYDINLLRILQLWPIVIIGLGISMLSLKGWAARLANVALIIGTLGAVVYVVSVPKIGNTDGELQGIAVDSTNISQDMPSEVRLEAGAISLNIDSDKAVELAEATLHSEDYTLAHTERVVRGRYQVVIETGPAPGGWSFTPFSARNSLDVRLGEGRLTDLYIDAGAASIDADLSSVMLRSLSIDTGVADASVKLGDDVRRLEVSIDVGASSIDLQVPEGSGVRVELDGGMSSRDFEGVSEVTDGVYESKGFSRSENQIIIKADTGASSFKITRY